MARWWLVPILHDFESFRTNLEASLRGEPHSNPLRIDGSAKIAELISSLCHPNHAALLRSLQDKMSPLEPDVAVDSRCVTAFIFTFTSSLGNVFWAALSNTASAYISQTCLLQM